MVVGSHIGQFGKLVERGSIDRRLSCRSDEGEPEPTEPLDVQLVSRVHEIPDQVVRLADLSHSIPADPKKLIPMLQDAIGTQQPN